MCQQNLGFRSVLWTCIQCIRSMHLSWGFNWSLWHTACLQSALYVGNKLTKKQFTRLDIHAQNKGLWETHLIWKMMKNLDMHKYSTRHQDIWVNLEGIYSVRFVYLDTDVQLFCGTQRDSPSCLHHVWIMNETLYLWTVQEWMMSVQSARLWQRNPYLSPVCV